MRLRRRCALATEMCVEEEPPLIEVGRRYLEPLVLHELAPICPGRWRRTRPAERHAGCDAARALRRSREGVQAERPRRACARACQVRSGLVRRSAWSVSRAAARRRWHGPCSESSSRRPATSSYGTPLAPRYRSARRADLRALQIIFQNPDSALNRRHSVWRILLRSLKKLAGCAGRRQRSARWSSPSPSGSRSARLPRSPCSSRAG